MNDENRMNDIEMKLAHLEMQVEDMSSVILAQEAEIAQLKQKIARAEGKIEVMGNDDSTDASLLETLAQERPPHY